MKPPTQAQHPLPVWQSALLTRGCQIRSGSRLFSLEMQPIGDRIVCTPAVDGSMVPFNLPVTIGEPVTIRWDDELSRYLVTTARQRLVA